MTRFTLALLACIFAVSPAFAEATSPGVFVVSAGTLNVRLAANTTGKVADKLFRGQRVEVFEVRDGWARISPDDEQAGNGARWVFATHLSAEPEADKIPDAPAADNPAENFVVTAGTLNVRLAANTAGKVADRLYRGQSVEVFELRDGWARVSPYFDGMSAGLPGKVARWVLAQHLASEAPVFERIAADSPVYEAIKASDDLQQYQHLFAAVSRQLIDSGQCKLSDFRDIGGWWRSTAHKPRSVYYTYCGGASNSDRIYVDTANATTFR